ncbi:MAG: Type II secretion system protein F [bacterium ADurb.Bin270]|nr:type II secretion system F family protein [Myxococcales bacterium]OQA61904.1 MAG: Type II secretion system protein F [bacterium ADurb.Bin270]HQG14090.1 type II secretion system F family protein [bacterium]
MPTFIYKARDKDGVLISGEIEAVSSVELKEGLFREGMVPISVKEVSKTFFSLKMFTDLFNKVRQEDIMIFTRQFYTLFKAGVSIDTILDTMIKQIRARTLRNALIRVRSDIGSGSTLAQAFGRHPQIFNELYVSMLAAGEEAGILEEVLSKLSALLSKDYEIKKNVKGATLYPKIVIFFLVVAVATLMTLVVPRFVEFYGRYDAELPLPTKLLIGISNFMRNYWYLVLGAAMAGFVAFRRFYTTKVGRFKMDALRLKMPVFGPLNLKVANSRFGHILAALYHSGLAMPRSLEVVANVIDNAAFGLEILKVRDDIKRGTTLSEAMSRQTYFPPVMIETAAVAERAGALDEMLSTVAEHFDLEVDHTIKNLTTLLEPILLVGIFAFVALLALAIFLPIWNMSSVVGGMH